MNFSTSSSRADSKNVSFDYSHLSRNLKPVNFMIQVPLVREVEQYPRFLDPRDPNCLDKAQQRLGPKYVLCLRTMLKAKKWGESETTTFALVKQFARQLSNHNLSSEET